MTDDDDDADGRRMQHYDNSSLEPMAQVRPRQTDWITIYALHPSKESAFPFVFNLIDTPGLGRTKRMNNDEALITSIEVLLKHVEKIDVVGFVVKSSDSRLSVSQRLLFDSFLNLFGDTISENMCALITFCDSQTPPVVNAMRSFHRALPSNNCFCFNNGSLFSKENKESNREAFWKTGKVQFDLLLEYLSTVMSQTVVLTSKQLKVRKGITYEIQRLEQVFLKIICLADNVFKKEHTIQQQKDTEQFEVETEVMESILRPVSYQNQKVMTCTRCHKTCCKNCSITKDYNRKFCPVFGSNGYCKMCRPKQCHYFEHTNTNGIMEFIPVKRKTVFKVLEMERQHVKRQLHQERQKLILSLLVILEEITNEHNALQKKARHPVTLTTLEQINNMIEITSTDSQLYPSGTRHILHTLKAELDCQQEAISSMRADDVIKELDELYKLCTY
ncbi:hypothetical protein FSP39_017438 [Pinctada imbricata]|uniref:AIG1-type G domain-containing protein n=1 Tax=Pinctada imbricata TaxID=66713 RepID=A0AA88XWZ3_PINIB|nr:hypothetical protein FSP39_017438 [Pinctada imbricata]